MERPAAARRAASTADCVRHRVKEVRVTVPKAGLVDSARYVPVCPILVMERPPVLCHLTISVSASVLMVKLELSAIWVSYRS